VETPGPETGGVEIVGAGTAEVAAGAFATGGAGCLRAKNKIAANRMIAAAEATRISVVEFDLVGFGLNDGDTALTAVPEGSAAGRSAACNGVSCGSGGVLRTLPLGAVLSGTLLGGTSVGRTMAAGTPPAGTWLGKPRLGAGGIGEPSLAKT